MDENSLKDSTKSTEYVVVARRYRPQTFDDLVGQATVTQALRNAISTDRIGHAYLFTGARGVGKTSAARIFAKALNCGNGTSIDPCGNCDACQQIASGGDVDVLEIDGASNRGIDEIRQLRANVGIRPSRSPYKVYIIDEVHMLTKEAFNALLKTLEEPPEHVKFVFCTTEPGKIPITVLSRCQRFDFSPVKTDKIALRLEQIVKAEGAQADPEALKLLARRAAGSMRDSQSLLEQLLSFVGNKISVEDVHSMFGTAQSERVNAVVEGLIAKDSAAALQQLQVTLDQGVDDGQLGEQLVVAMRDILAAGVGADPNLYLFYAPNDSQKLTEMANRWGTETLLAAIEIFDQAVTRMRQSMHSRILLEVALIRVAKLEDLDELASVISQVCQGDSAIVPAEAKKKTAPVTDSPSRNRQSETAKTDSVESPSEADLPNETEPLDDESRSDEEFASIEFSKENASKIWSTALRQIEDLTADFASHACQTAISGPNHLAVYFHSRYNSSRAQCERPERRQSLEKAISQIVGKAVRLDFQVIHEDKAHETPKKPTVGNHQLRKRLASHPMVECAVELFEAEITKVDPGT